MTDEELKKLRNFPNNLNHCWGCGTLLPNKITGSVLTMRLSLHLGDQAQHRRCSTAIRYIRQKRERAKFKLEDNLTRMQLCANMLHRHKHAAEKEAADKREQEEKEAAEKAAAEKAAAEKAAAEKAAAEKVSAEKAAAEKAAAEKREQENKAAAEKASAEKEAAKKAAAEKAAAEREQEENAEKEAAEQREKAAAEKAEQEAEWREQVAAEKATPEKVATEEEKEEEKEQEKEQEKEEEKEEEYKWKISRDAASEEVQFFTTFSKYMKDEGLKKLKQNYEMYPKAELDKNGWTANGIRTITGDRFELKLPSDEEGKNYVRDVIEVVFWNLAKRLLHYVQSAYSKAKPNEKVQFNYFALLISTEGMVPQIVHVDLMFPNMQIALALSETTGTYSVNPCRLAAPTSAKSLLSLLQLNDNVECTAAVGRRWQDLKDDILDHAGMGVLLYPWKYLKQYAT